MAATIIQTRWRKYINRKNNPDDVCSINSRDLSMHGNTARTCKKQHKKSAFANAPDTARTDNMLLEFEDDINISKKSVSEGDHCSAIDEIDEDGQNQMVKNVAERNVAAKDHRYVVTRPKDWTDNVLPEN